MESTSLKMTALLKKKLESAGLFSMESILRYYPSRYDDIQIRAVHTWIKGEKVWLEGQILEPIRMNRIRKNLTVTKFLLQSHQGLFQVSLFNRPWLKALMTISLYARFDGQNQLTGLNYNTRPLSDQLGLHPIYRLKQDLSHADLQKATKFALSQFNNLDFVDVPAHLKEKYRLLDLRTALHQIHQPNSLEGLKQASRTLKYEEFLRFQTKLQINRQDNFGQSFGITKVFDRRLIQDWKQKLPFELTAQQEIVLNEILNDLQSKHRMYRLLQGDVGSGKTVIAALAMVACVMAHYQAALLVPTEILAYQHYRTLQTYVPSTFRIEVLTSSTSTLERKQILDDLRLGKIDILIGTHSIIQDSVVFKNVGLVVADEQHRFGVHQRQALSEKGEKVDFLLMSATPIPRTLASVLFGDLDVSSITAYHSTKAKTVTTLIRENSIKSILPVLLKEIEAHHQIYVVCPAIEESEDSEVMTVERVYKALRKVLPTDVKIGQLHGKLTSKEKESTLAQFNINELQLLVTTTVIEVGVNVLNANTMVIYDSDRFGLSQLHQLRGRVGRGHQEGQCFLLSDSKDELSLQRLEVMVNSTDGFEIANKDLELRGPGEIFGLKQSGIPGFLIANVILDQAILVTAQHDAIELLKVPVAKMNQAFIESCRKELNEQTLD